MAPEPPARTAIEPDPFHLDRQIEAADNIVEIPVGGNDNLEAAVQKRRMEEIVGRFLLQGLWKLDQPQRFPFALPGLLNGLIRSTVVQAELQEIVVTLLMRENPRTALLDPVWSE